MDAARPDRLVEPVDGTSLQEVVYLRLREAIKAGKFLSFDPERKVPLRLLAQELSVSTTPVREAIRRLEAEGLVTMSRSGGMHVNQLSPLVLEEVTAMRQALEELALRRAALRLGPEELGRCREIAQRLDQTDDPQEWRQLNYDFHWTLYSACDYPRLLSTLRTLWVVLEPHLTMYFTSRENLEVAQKEHWDLLEALERGNVDTALDVTQSHIARTDEVLDAMLAHRARDTG